MSDIKGPEWTFNTVSSEFDRWRPAYIPRLYDDIFAAGELSPASKVLEIGIGTGQATRPFLETGCSLTAVELGDNLARYSRDKFAAYKNLNIVNMAFQDFECSPESYDLVYSGSAFHWIEEEAGYKKVFQILKKDGVFARFANHPYYDKGREDITEAIQKLYNRYMPESSPSNEYGEEQARKRAEIGRKYGFTDISYRIYHRTRTFTAGEYTSLLGTYSDHIAMEPVKRSRFFREIEDVIDQLGGSITLYDTIDLQLARKP